jgi:hypothetical protein
MSTRLLSPAVLLLAVAGLLGGVPAQAQEFKTFMVPDGQFKPLATPHPECRGKSRKAVDVVFEGVKTTAYNWATTGGGGEGGRYDPTPVLSTKVQVAGGCLNAHLSAMVGSAQTYGVSRMTLFQVTVTDASGLVRHMAGHYETPYGIYAPAVALSAEYDVDMLGSNFYLPVGTAAGQIPPGSYRVDVWWAGGPVGGGGAIGADFVLKLYYQ